MHMGWHETSTVEATHNPRAEIHLFFCYYLTDILAGKNIQLLPLRTLVSLVFRKNTTNARIAVIR